ncbi:glycosyl transferase [Mycobacterium kyorinense]|uniref:Glycosyl transferase n=1 Tax=Mycobacterium kyorinense TaxID=487514 RepID=A0A1A2Z2F5_9MYCO|nr:glycosyltransferase family 4 protein [Mycobacterium kyorinense]OBI43838.1 glycosyl transferase [Mycobacterium kyorinense]
MADRLRVLVVGPAPAGALSRGGMATVAAMMAAHPDDRFAVTVVPTYVDGPLHRRLATGVRGMLCATWVLLCRRADVLHVHLAHGGSVVRKALPLAAARLAGVPAVVHGHSYDFGGWFDRLPHVAKHVVRRLLVADQWLVLGKRHIEEYAYRLQLSDRRIDVLPNAVQIPDVAVNQSGDESVHAVAVGRLGERKGSYDVIAAIGVLDEAVRARLRVTLAGDGDVEQVRAAVAAADLTGRIDVPGWMDSAARDELLGSAHIFLLPSRDEGLPMALLEAMAYGLVPVTTTVGSIGEVVTDGLTGVVVRPGCPAEIADVLTALVDDDTLRARLGVAARGRARHFGLDGWYERLGQLWMQLAGDRPVLR